MDRRIIVESKSEAVDVYGFRSLTWSTLITVWANIVHETGKEQTDNKDRGTQRMIKFRTRYNDTITNEMRIIWNGNHYKIEDIKEIGRREGLLIFTNLLAQT